MKNAIKKTSLYILSFALILSIFIIQGCGGGSYSSSGSVSGTVTDADSGAKLKGVNITLASETTTTDGNGQYVISASPGGVYELKAVKSGYFDYSEKVTLTEGKILSHSFTMKTVPDSPAVTGVNPSVQYHGGEFTITGSNFGSSRSSRDNGESYVSFIPESGGNPIKATEYSEWSSTRIKCTIPPPLDDSPNSNTYVVIVNRVLTEGTVSSTSTASDSNRLKVESAIGWAAGNSIDDYGAILRTEDGGNTWVRKGSKTVVPDVPLYDVFAIDDKKVWVVGANDGKFVILYSDDEGATWTRQAEDLASPSDLYGITTVDGSKAWAVGDYGSVLYTENGGQSWTPRATGIPSDAFLQAVSALDENKVWAAGQNRDNGQCYIFYTDNGGQSWTQQPVEDQASSEGLIDITTIDAYNAYTGGPYAIYKTTNGGADWKKVLTLPEHSNGIYAQNSEKAWSAIDYGTIMYTKDGGKNWQEPENIDAFSAIKGLALMGVCFMEDGQTGCVVGINLTGWQNVGTILRTTDGGKNWKEIKYPVVTGLRRVSFSGVRK